MSGGYPFARRQRLLKAAEFEAVFAHRCSWRTPLFQILARPNQTGLARLGMVVSKRLLSRSVDRNRMRRKIRETFRLIAAELPALDLVVRPLALQEGKAEMNNPAQETPAQKDKAWRDELLGALEKAAEKCNG